MPYKARLLRLCVRCRDPDWSHPAEIEPVSTPNPVSISSSAGRTVITDFERRKLPDWVITLRTGPGVSCLHSQNDLDIVLCHLVTGVLPRRLSHKSVHVSLLKLLDDNPIDPALEIHAQGRRLVVAEEKEK